ncbi:MAG: phosphatidate cytidylyltransferase, partial [Deltaproteobacteria bacterium]|nr:phosphatidate cytidylyltransferase [Deltaproteobacteria bacterium]
ITLGGLIYLGWVGAYMVDLRSLPDGGWWVMFIFPVVWLADSGAYSIGARYGTHKMFPRLSPNKSWEGYWAGVLMGTLYGGFFAFMYTKFGPLHVDIWQGVLIGFVLSTITTLGDLGESLFKREAVIKDSGNLFPGHGGAFDRIDSLIWAAVIGVYMIRFFFL